MGEREITVYVFKEERPGRKPMWTAYTRWASPEWNGCRVVNVMAANGAEAKRIAIAAEKARDAAEAEASNG